MAAFGEPGVGPKLSPFVSLCVCVRGADSRRPSCAMVFGVGTTGGARRGGRLGGRGLRTDWISEPDLPRPIPDPSPSFGSAQAGLRESLGSAVPGRWVGAPAPQGRRAGKGMGRQRPGGTRRAAVDHSRSPDYGLRPAFLSPGGWLLGAGIPGRRGGTPRRAGPGRVHCVNWPSTVFEGLSEPRCSATGPGVERLWDMPVGLPTPQVYYYFSAVTFRVGHLLHAVEPLEIP